MANSKKLALSEGGEAGRSFNELTELPKDESAVSSAFNRGMKGGFTLEVS